MKQVIYLHIHSNIHFKFCLYERQEVYENRKPFLLVVFDQSGPKVSHFQFKESNFVHLLQIIKVLPISRFNFILPLNIFLHNEYFTMFVLKIK